MTRNTCTHEHTTSGRDYAYTGSVAVAPYTNENRAAHGCITYTETCSACGAQRAVNANQCHYEYGTWGPTLAQRQADERRAAERKAAKQREADLAVVRRLHVRITDLDLRRAGRPGERVIRMVRDGRDEQPVSLHDIQAAASQEDTGDGVVPFYRGLLALVEDQTEARRSREFT